MGWGREGRCVSLPVLPNGLEFEKPCPTGAVSLLPYWPALSFEGYRICGELGTTASQLQTYKLNDHSLVQITFLSLLKRKERKQTDEPETFAAADLKASGGISCHSTC